MYFQRRNFIRVDIKQIPLANVVFDSDVNKIIAIFYFFLLHIPVFNYHRILCEEYFEFCNIRMIWKMKYLENDIFSVILTKENVGR